MQILAEPMRSSYLKAYPIQSFFSIAIDDLIQVHAYKRGEFIIREGSFPEYLFYLIEGKGKIYYTHHNGKVSLINFILPGTFIGEVELLQESYYSKGIQTANDVVCFAIPVYACKEALLQDATFLRHLCTFLSNKATVIAAKYTQSLAYPLENRLADFILLSSNGHLYQEKHTEVCEYLGVSYRHLLHVLSHFCEKGYLEKDGRSFIIKDEKSLEELASPISPVK
ncbi:transcriptional regulator YeiL [Bacillus sp. 1P06AnD]|uniref:transcriptional regulator YeiL n=1 Tax=Bacillus sp. 1P06AnD TaxID=3132208 RepID=UPI00399F67AA